MAANKSKNSKENIVMNMQPEGVTPLEERINRLAYCDVSDPAFSEWAMKQLCGVRVMRDLRSVRLSKHASTLETQCMRNFSKNPDDITMGDLAALITEWYLEDEECIPRGIRIYLGTFLMVMDHAATLIRREIEFARKRGYTPVDVSGKRWNYAVEFLRMPLADIMEMTAVSKAPAREKEDLMNYIAQRGWTEYTCLHEVYEELNDSENAGQPGGFVMAPVLMSETGSILRESAGSENLMAVIRLMVMPVAFMAAAAGQARS